MKLQPKKQYGIFCRFQDGTVLGLAEGDNKFEWSLKLVCPFNKWNLRKGNLKKAGKKSFKIPGSWKYAVEYPENGEVFVARLSSKKCPVKIVGKDKDAEDKYYGGNLIFGELV